MPSKGGLSTYISSSAAVAFDDKVIQVTANKARWNAMKLQLSLLIAIVENRIKCSVLDDRSGGYELNSLRLQSSDLHDVVRLKGFLVLLKQALNRFPYGFTRGRADNFQTD